MRLSAGYMLLTSYKRLRYVMCYATKTKEKKTKFNQKINQIYVIKLKCQRGSKI